MPHERDRYAQLVNAPGLSAARRPARPAAAGRARAPPRGQAGPLRGRPLRRRPRRPPRAGAEGQPRPDRGRTGRRRGQGQGAGLRRLRDRRLDRAGRAAALLLPRRRPPAAQRPRDRPRHPRRRGGLDPRGDRPARARGLHPLARQGDRRPRRDLPARARRRGRRGPARVDAALPPLAEIGLRLRAGGRGRQGRRAASRPRLGAAAGRQDGAGHRRLPRDRRRDRRRPSPATAPQVVGLDIPQAAAELGAVTAAIDGDAIELDITAAGRPGADRRALRRRHRRRRPQRRRHQGPDDREDARGALGDADGDQPLQRGADQRRAARRRPAAPPTAASSASPRCRGSPATPARPTTRPRRPA